MCAGQVYLTESCPRSPFGDTAAQAFGLPETLCESVFAFYVRCRLPPARLRVLVVRITYLTSFACLQQVSVIKLSFKEGGNHRTDLIHQLSDVLLHLRSFFTFALGIPISVTLLCHGTCTSCCSSGVGLRLSWTSHRDARLIYA